MGLLDLKESEVSLAKLDHQALLEIRVTWVLLVYQDLYPSVENKENRAPLDLLGELVNKGQLEIEDQQVQLEHQVQEDNLDHQVHEETLDLLGQLDRPVNLGNLVRQEQLAVMVSRVSKASKEILALMEHQVHYYLKFDREICFLPNCI